MLQHYLLLAFRNFKRFKNSFFINLIGLSTGLACTLFIYLWVTDELKVDQFHEKDTQLFQVMEHQQYAGDIMTTSSTPGVLAEALKEEYPEFEYTATTTWISPFTLSIEDHNVKADGYYVGADFFNIFSYDLIQGNKDQVLADKTSITISESLAKKLFDTTEDILGKTIEVQHKKNYKLTGVFKDVPKNSSYQFDFVLPFEQFKDENEWVTSWGNNGPPTFAVLKKGTNPQELEKKIADFVKKKNEQSNVTLFLKPYSERYLFGSYENGVQSGGRIEYVRLFSIIAAFILFIACINFMNLSTARASRRVKEVGVKKALGIKRSALISQFLGESMVMAFLSIFVALILVVLFLPQFNEITEKKIALALDGNLVLSLLAIALLTGIISGSYPALYLSGFRPVVVLKGEIRSSLGELWARRGLVIFQFILSIMLIVSVAVVYKQIEFVQKKNLGFNKDNVIYFPMDGKVEESRETFLNELKRIPGVVNATSVGHDMIGRQNNTSGLEWEGKNPDDKILFENVRSDFGLIETLGIEMKEGRSFSTEFSTDTSKIIFNEAGIKVMGLQDPIGKVIKLWGEYDLEIIGVAKDFHFQSLHEEVSPLFFIINPEITWNIMARIEAGKEKETLEKIKDFYQDFNPGFTFDYQFLDQEYANQYKAEQRVATLSQYFAGFAILISCLGLFGLATFTAERRLKEIGIRKVLGSSVINIIYLLSGDFTRMVVIAIFIALPISYFALDNWLQRFAYRIDLEIWFFIGAGFLALLIAWITVGMQAVKAANVNPAKCLRSE
ncbi:ABC transporter permease [Flexithrix dorotheae]|uniref:ABC transporter permease n=1 Tax=Flexithrix dorotheae TaxID=70993 RepID=UPI0003626936|nr:ABC transporter permease [Flexithrix dorotheae]